MKTRKPDFNGHAKAWKMNWGNEGSAPAHLVHYLIEGNFHPLWNQWALSLVSLADISGIPPAAKHHPDNTHEIMIISVNPDFKINPDKSPGRGWMLHPFDVAKQFKVPMDMDAEDLAKNCVKAICDGAMSPDQDFRSIWNKIIDSTAEHYFGKHKDVKQ